MDSVSDFIEDMKERQFADFALVREHLGRSAKRRKMQYDDNVHTCDFHPGQLVWYYYPRRCQGLSPKWQSYYTGPYRVVRLIDLHNVVIQRTKRAKCIIVHRDKLKPCLDDSLVCPDVATNRDSMYNLPHLLENCDGTKSQSLYNGPQLNCHSPQICQFHDTPQLTDQHVQTNEPSIRTRLQRTTAQPKHLSDYAVGCVVNRNMLNKGVEVARACGTMCLAWEEDSVIVTG